MVVCIQWQFNGCHDNDAAVSDVDSDGCQRLLAAASVTRCSASSGSSGRHLMLHLGQVAVMSSTQHRHDRLAKRSAAETVDDEVDGRVGDDHQVAESFVVEERTRAGLGVVAEHDEQQLGGECRRLTDDEDQHDDDQHQGDVVLGAASCVRR